MGRDAAGRLCGERVIALPCRPASSLFCSERKAADTHICRFCAAERENAVFCGDTGQNKNEKMYIRVKCKQILNIFILS